VICSGEAKFTFPQAYLQPCFHRVNLVVLTGAQVTRIKVLKLVDGQVVANGVQFVVENSDVQFEARAFREIILSAGRWSSQPISFC